MLQPVLAGRLQCDEVDHEVFLHKAMFIAPEFKDIYLDWGCMGVRSRGSSTSFLLRVLAMVLWLALSTALLD